MSSFDPDIELENGIPYKHHRYNEIVEEQVTISFVAPGISMEYTDDVSPYDRKLILDTILKIQEARKKAAEEEKANNARKPQPHRPPPRRRYR